jgi:hypothetical protein
MLNELHKLSATLAAHGIRQREWHREYKILPGGSCFRVWLAADGMVANIELMDKTLAAQCRKYGSNQQAFPAFNIAALYRITSKEDKDYFDSLAEGKAAYDGVKLRALCAHDNWSRKLLRKIDACLHKKIPKIPADSAISELMRIAARLGSAAFRSSLENCVWNRLRDDVPSYLPLLLYQGSENKKPEDDFGSCSIILDLSDWEKYGYPIASEATTKQINDWLTAGNAETDPPPTGDLDAFDNPCGDIGEPMPSVKLAPGFEAVLRAMFREQTCQYRYRKADDASFPIARKKRGELKTSLEWIAQAENEGVMWRKIDNGAIIFVYPDKLPKIRPHFAALFAGDEAKVKGVTESRFKDIAKNLIETLNAIAPHEKPKNLVIFALQQIPPALSKRAKVVFTRDLTVDSLIHAAEEWRSGCENLPDKMGFDIEVPFPLGVSKTANKVWKRDGARADGKTSAKLMQYYQGMELLLDKPQPSRIMRIVRGVTSNALGLILFAANQLPRAGGKKGKIGAVQKEEIERLLPLFGLLLLKSGIVKEVYMQEAAYLTGQLLKISDELHALYCEIKRDGDIPPQLAGNAVFVTASENPAQALALLCTRMIPYIAWAKQYSQQEQDKSGLAGWFLSQYEALAPKLREKLTSNIRFGDLEKAQLFIGYLAALPKSDKKEPPKQEDAKNGQ